MRRFGLPIAMILLAVTALPAENLSGADQILCSSAHAVACTAEEGCESAAPWEWNIPSFIEIDLVAKRLSTTEASEEYRVTPILTAAREEGKIFLQGVEKSRAFSFIIDEATGMATVAVARDGFTVSVFGACTPKAN